MRQNRVITTRYSSLVVSLTYYAHLFDFAETKEMLVSWNTGDGSISHSGRIIHEEVPVLWPANMLYFTGIGVYLVALIVQKIANTVAIFDEGVQA